MKIFSIFNKNLKTVSRNLNYFAMLFICPLVLILVAAAVLNSNDIKNIRIGVVDEDPGYDFNLEKVVNVHSYDSLVDCLYDFLDAKLAVCLHVREVAGIHRVDIFVDNSQRSSGVYTKQFILEEVVQEQSYFIEQTSGEMNSKLAVYSASISEAKQELIKAREDLDEQERILHEYQRNLTILRQNFDEIYWTLKEFEPGINLLKNEIYEDRANLQNNITYFKNKKQQIDSNIVYIKSILIGKLVQDDYDGVVLRLDSVASDLD